MGREGKKINWTIFLLLENGMCRFAKVELAAAVNRPNIILNSNCKQMGKIVPPFNYRILLPHCDSCVLMQRLRSQPYKSIQLQFPLLFKGIRSKSSSFHR